MNCISIKGEAFVCTTTFLAVGYFENGSGHTDSPSILTYCCYKWCVKNLKGHVGMEEDCENIGIGRGPPKSRNWGSHPICRHFHSLPPFLHALSNFLRITCLPTFSQEVFFCKLGYWCI